MTSDEPPSLDEILSDLDIRVSSIAEEDLAELPESAQEEIAAALIKYEDDLIKPSIATRSTWLFDVVCESTTYTIVHKLDDDDIPYLLTIGPAEEIKKAH